MLQPVLELEAPEAVEGIPQLAEDAGRRLVVHRREVPFEEGAAEPERSHTPVDPMRLIQVEQRPVDIAEEVPQSVALEGRELEEHEMILEEIREEKIGALRGAETRHHDGVQIGRASCRERV